MTPSLAAVNLKFIFFASSEVFWRPRMLPVDGGGEGLHGGSVIVRFGDIFEIMTPSLAAVNLKFYLFCFVGQLSGAVDAPIGQRKGRATWQYRQLLIRFKFH